MEEANQDLQAAINISKDELLQNYNFGRCAFLNGEGPGYDFKNLIAMIINRNKYFCSNFQPC